MARKPEPLHPLERLAKAAGVSDPLVPLTQDQPRVVPRAADEAAKPVTPDSLATTISAVLADKAESILRPAADAMFVAKADQFLAEANRIVVAKADELTQHARTTLDHMSQSAEAATKSNAAIDTEDADESLPRRRGANRRIAADADVVDERRPDLTVNDKLSAREADAVEAFIAANGITKGSVRLFRRRSWLGENTYQYVGNSPISDFSLDTVKAIYGGGDFRARFVDDSSRYLSGVPPMEFSIDYGAKSRDAADNASSPTNAPILALIDKLDKAKPTPPPDPMAMMMPMLTMMQQQSQQMMTLFAEMGKANAAMIAGLANAPKPAFPTELITGVAVPIVLKLLEQKKSNDPLEDMMKLKSLMDSLRDDDGGKSVWERLAPVAASALGSIVGGQRQPAQVIVGSPEQPAPTQPQPSLPPQPTLPDKFLPFVSVLKQLGDNWPMIHFGFVRGFAPDRAAEILSSTLDDDGYAAAVALLEREDWHEALSMFPESGPMMPWLGQVREALLREEAEDIAHAEAERNGELDHLPHD